MALVAAPREEEGAKRKLRRAETVTQFDILALQMRRPGVFFRFDSVRRES
jgi:hypothetical protein